MKIAMITPRRERCGVSIYTADLVNALRLYGNVEVFTNPNLKRPDEQKRIARETAQHDLLHIQYHPDLYGFWRYPKQLSQWNRWIKNLRKPVVVTVHDLILTLTPRPVKSLKDFLFNTLAVPYVNKTQSGRFLRGGFLFSADELIVHSEIMKNFLHELGIPRSKITVLYPGVPEIPAGSVDIREKYFLPRKRLLTCFGFIRRNKGFEKILDVLPQLPEDICFVIAGAAVDPDSKKYENELRKQVRETGLTSRVLFTGEIAQETVGPLLRQSDALLLPYDSTAQTGTSYALSYMMGAKRPIVMSDTPFLSEISRLNPQLFLFRQNDRQELRETILQALNAGESASSHEFANEWSWKNAALKTWNIYERVLRGLSV